MRILYGVAGEGMGHATRSKVVIDHLRRRGHDVLVAVSNRACEFLARNGARVVEIVGLRLHYVDGAMDLNGTVALNAQASPEMLLRNLGAYTEVMRFAPELVITDFEPFATYHALMHGLPCISIDNHQIIPRCDHTAIVRPEDGNDLRTMEAFVTFVAPSCAHYVVTSFFEAPVRAACASSTTIVPPILRDAIVRARPSDRGHVLVYQTALGDSRLLEMLHAFPKQRFVVYGLRRDAVDGNCTLKGFREQEFVDDLASARAVVTNGGASLLGEAVALRKPAYVVPVRNQFEQILNARYIAKLGYGVTSDRFDAPSLEAFLAGVPFFATRLRAAAPHDGNARLYAAVDGLMGDVGR